MERIEEMELRPPVGELDDLMYRLRIADQLSPRIQAMVATILVNQQDLSRTYSGLLEMHYGGDQVRAKLRLDLSPAQ